MMWVAARVLLMVGIILMIILLVDGLAPHLLDSILVFNKQ